MEVIKAYKSTDGTVWLEERDCILKDVENVFAEYYKGNPMFSNDPARVPVEHVIQWLKAHKLEVFRMLKPNIPGL